MTALNFVFSVYIFILSGTANKHIIHVWYIMYMYNNNSNYKVHLLGWLPILAQRHSMIMDVD